jgi:hypothetical protein
VLDGASTVLDVGFGRTAAQEYRFMVVELHSCGAHGSRCIELLSRRSV